MRVLDIHIHVGRKEHLTPRFISYFEENFGPDLLSLMDTFTPESFAGFLQREGVELGVLLAEYSPHVTGVMPNEFVAEVASQTDRLIAFGSIDLSSSVDAGAQTERCVRELGCRGLKLLPPYGHYYPADPRLFPAYEAASDLGIPVMFHTGTSLFPGTRVRFADPLLLDDVAEEFGDLVIIMSHGGRPFWYKQAQWMLARHKNVYIDLSGIPPKQILSAFPKLEKFPDRFVFGSDWPNVSIAEQIRKIRQLNLNSATLNAILWDNASRLLKID